MNRWLPLCLLLITLTFTIPVLTRADELDDTTKALLQKQDQLQQAQKVLQQAKDQVSALSGDLPSLQTSLNIAIAEVNVKQAQLDATIAQLDQQEAQLKQQQVDRELRARSLYKQYKKDAISPMLSLLDANDFRTWTRLISYHENSLNDDKTRILSLDQQVTKLAESRAKLQAEADSLRSQKEKYQAQVNSIKSQIANAKYRQTTANNQISNINNDVKGLSAKQQQILAAKAAANATSTIVGDAPPPSSPPPPPTFSGAAFAFASYGAPHRVGMSQYGAKGRAEAGQGYQAILSSYFAGVSVAPYSLPPTITVNGFSPEYNQNFDNEVYDFEEYIKHLYEMPASWPMEALKAQAVAARTYAAKWVKDRPGQTICPSQSCQVIKHEINGTRWQEAVEATRGIVITSGGNPISAWFSSTVGGYTQTSAQVWGGVTSYTQVTPDYAGSWPNGAYDKQSPWFHKAWGERPEGSPWLTKAEMVWMLNAAIRYQETNDASSISADLSTFTSPLSDFTDLATSIDNSTGQTSTIIVIGTNQGTVNIKGSAVRAAVNLKTPGTIELKSTLFDVIKY